MLFYTAHVNDGYFSLSSYLKIIFEFVLNKGVLIIYLAVSRQSHDNLTSKIDSMAANKKSEIRYNQNLR